MNYLAHAYLSFMHEDIMVGNLISDFVKGRKRYDFSAGVQKGITLHRAIDTFTDQHPLTQRAKDFLRPAVGLYCGAFIDVVYDHFLALDAASWLDVSLKEFTPGVYLILQNNYSVLPGKLQYMLPYMTGQNWLYNYQFEWGIERSFMGIVRRAQYLDQHQPAFNAFMENYSDLQELSHEFIPAVKKFAEQEFNELLKG